MSTKHISDIAPPANLSNAQMAEFNVLARALEKLENKWIGLRQDENPDLLEYAATFNREFDIVMRQCDVIEQLDLESIEREYEEQKERIRQEFKDDEKNLFRRMIRGYQLKHEKCMAQLKELMGPDFEQYQAENDLGFPQIPIDKNQERKGPQPEGPKIAFGPHETEKQLKEIKNDVQNWTGSVNVSEHTE